MNEVRNVSSKKGFTLVELLAVIIILGIILVLAVPRISDMITKYREKAYNIQLGLILEAAEKYAVLYEDEIDWIGDRAFIKLRDLQNKDLITKPAKNPKGGVFDPEETIITLNRDENGLLTHTVNIITHYSDDELEAMINQGYIPIANAGDLNKIKDSNATGFAMGTKWECLNCKGGLDKKYVQVAIVDLGDYGLSYDNGQGWEPIGGENYELEIEYFFEGIYDGNNYMIINLYINRPSDAYMGLFGISNDGAEFNNISLENINIVSESMSGGLVGRVKGETIIANSYVTGKIESGFASGGLVGYGEGDGKITIANSYVIGSIKSSSSAGGGLIGTSYNNNDIVISNSYVIGKVKSDGAFSGGLIGSLYGDGNIIIGNSHTTCQVEADNSFSGGLIGSSDKDETIINNSYTTGNIIGTVSYVGGLIGSSKETVITKCYATGNITGEYHGIGGLVGGMDSNKLIINNSYTTGKVIGNNAGYVGGLVGSGQEIIITNSYVKGNITSVNGGFIGGLVGGGAAGTTITKSYSTGRVESGGAFGGGLAGGLMGLNIVVSDSYATGNIIGKDNNGGLIGGISNANIYNCYAIGNVTGSTGIGGLIGLAESNNEISNCYAIGNITGDEYVGGLVAINVGGNQIINCYATGNVSGDEYVGGLVGLNGGSEANNSYWDIMTSGQEYSDGGEGRTTVQMKQQSTFVDWDFTDIWQIQENITYPYFR